MKTTLQKLLPLFLLLPVVLACGVAEKIQKGIEEANQPKVLTSTAGDCQLTVPGLWQTATGLHDDAIIQASYTLGDVHVIVLPDERQDFADTLTLDKFTKIIRDDLPTRFQDAQLTEPVATNINMLEAREFEVSGTVENIKVKYMYATVSSHNRFYQVIVWTTPSRYERNKSDMTNVVHSFKVMSRPPAAGDRTPGRKVQ